jgi:mannosylglycerate hydrolase
MKKILHLVFQTHWDREWYFPFEQYRYRLIHVIERAMRALEQNEIASFILDGQTLPLEDYFEVCEPKDKKRILALIKDGRMIIGPWYIAMDEFLVHGESIIRNLEIGGKIARQYGEIQRVGYLPDTFGHIGQMPQILRGFDIDNAIMWRGVHLKDSEFIWQGVDESKLFTLFLVDGYYHPELNQNNRLIAIQNYVKRNALYARTENILMTAGGDHLMPINDHLDQKIAEVRAASPDFEICVSSYESYIQTVRNQLNVNSLFHVKGELRDNTNAYILPNVLSTRSYLKKLNQQLEDDMIGYVEPIMALAYLKSKNAPYRYVEHIWKTILQNQPHDSICGCSVDEVHLENEMRAEKARQMIFSLKEGMHNQLNVLSMTFYGNKSKKIDDDDMRFSVYNPHPYAFSGVIEGIIWLNNDTPQTSFMIQDDNQQTYQVAIDEIEPNRLFVSPLDYPPLFRQGKAFKIKVIVKDLAPLAMNMFTVIEGETLPVDSKIDYTLENEKIKVTLQDNGSLTVFDKKNKTEYPMWNRFYSSMDAGDSYNYSKPEQDTISYAYLNGEPIASISAISQSLQYKLILVQPEALDSSRKFAVETKTTSTIDVKLTLHYHESIVRVSVIINQKGKDQRLRMQFPMNVHLDEHINDSAFELVTRSSNRKEVFIAARQKEVPVVVDSSLSMIHGVKDKNGIKFFHRGLHESQMIEEEGKTSLEVTLIRSVGHLSRDDFGSRGGAAGPNLETPDAQCIRIHQFDYAFGPIDTTQEEVDSYRQALEFRRPPILLKAYGERQLSLLIKENDKVVMTSLRLINQYQIEVRFWNPSKTVQKTALQSKLKIERIEEVFMNHAPKQIMESLISFKPNEIKTLNIKYKSR